MVAPGGACMVALGGAWFFGGCVVFSGGMCVVFFRGCMVFSGGGACVGNDEIRSMSGRYASYWNAFLFKLKMLIHNKSIKTGFLMTN